MTAPVVTVPTLYARTHVCASCSACGSFEPCACDVVLDDELDVFGVKS